VSPPGTNARAATIGLSFVSAITTLAVHALIGVYYCFDQLSSPLAERT
jgi:hypothetical protein